MRILYVLSEDLNRTGSGIVHFLAVARALKKLGHEVVIMGPQYSSTIRRRRDLKGIYIPVPGRNALSFLLFQLFATVLFPLIVLIHRPEALLVRGGGVCVYWLMFLVGRFFGVSSVAEVNGISWAELKSRGFPSWLSRLSLWSSILECRIADRVISVTPAIGDELVRVSGISPQRVCAIQNGADPDELGAGNREGKRMAMGIRPDQFVVGFVGDFSPWHGSRELIGSALMLAPETRRKVPYVLVGAGGDMKAAKRAVLRAGLKDVVRFPGWASRREVADYLAAFDVGVLVNTDPGNTRIPGSPLKFWEYLAAGLPVIVSDDPYLTPLVRRENMGIVVEKPFARSIAAGIADIYRRREDFAAIGRRNRELVKRKYSWREVARKVSAVLADASAGPRR